MRILKLVDEMGTMYLVSYRGHTTMSNDLILALEECQKKSLNR